MKQIKNLAAQMLFIYSYFIISTLAQKPIINERVTVWIEGKNRRMGFLSNYDILSLLDVNCVEKNSAINRFLLLSNTTKYAESHKTIK